MGDSEIDSPEALRILMTADAVGGVWQYSIDLAKELARRNARILLATLGPRPSDQQRSEALAIPGLVLNETDFALEWMQDPWRDVDASGNWLLDLAADFAPHVIHLNGYSHAALHWRPPVLVVAHSCVFSWWRAVHGEAPGEEWSEYRRRVTAGLAAVDALVAPSSAMAAALAREYDLDAANIRVIHNFSRVSRMDRSEKQPFILASGRIWDPAKNIQLLNSIVPHVDWPIRITGAQNASFRDEKAHFLGFLTRPEMLDQMNRAGIFVHPALYEPFGLAILEAANARCALVLSDIPTLRELWSDAAIFVNPRDPEQWIAALNALARDAIARHKLADAAFSRANKYRASRSVKKYWNLYRSLAVGPQKTRKEAAA